MKKHFKTIYKIARENAGLTQEKAAELLAVSTRWLAEYESGRAPVPDEIVCKMVEIYDAPWLAYQHLKQSTKIGRKFLPDIEILDVARAVLKFKKEVQDIEKLDKDMIEIACDGVIDTHEKRWQEIKKEVSEVISAAIALMLSEVNKKEKALMERAV